jgi:hypothetical protein
MKILSNLKLWLSYTRNSKTSVFVRYVLQTALFIHFRITQKNTGVRIWCTWSVPSN